MYFSIINLFIGVSFFAIGILATFLFIKSQSASGKMLAYAGFSTAVWILASFVYKNIGAVDKELLLFLARIQYLAGAVLITTYMFFTHACSGKDGRQKRVLFAAGGGLFVLFSALIIFTDTMIKDVEIFKDYRVMVYGYLYPLYVFYMILLAAAGYYYLIGRLLAVTARMERAQLIYIFIGSTITLVVSFVVDIILPVFGIQSLLWFGPISAVFFVVFASYAILRHHLFEVRVITTELLVFAILITVFIQIFLASGFQEVFLNTLLFLAVGFFSIFLLRSVYVEIEQREKIERLARRLSDTISFATHELRTPVTKFRGYLSMLLEGEYGNLQTEARKCVEICFGAAAEMNQNIETFLNLNKLEIGKLEIFEQKADLQGIIAECLSDFTLKAKEKNINLNFIEKDELPEVSVDKFQIRHVINNLISNAIKYTPKGGRVTIQVRKEAEGANLVFSIEDTGIGIPPDVLPHLFSIYERGGEKAKSVSEGSGVGLFLAAKIIDLHRGKIWAESEGVDKGSRFYFSLPIKETSNVPGGAGH